MRLVIIKELYCNDYFQIACRNLSIFSRSTLLMAFNGYKYNVDGMVLLHVSVSLAGESDQ